MKPLLTFLSVLFMLHGCAAVLAEERPWSFVTAVGGLEVGTPVRSNETWLLPVRADVSGLQAITNRPTTLNSAVVCEAVKAHFQGQDIFLILETTVAHDAATSRCPAAKLGKLAGGHYDVWYGASRAEGISLGTVDVAL